MNTDFFDFYPFNMHSGFDFLMLYAGVGMLGLFVLTLVRRTYGIHLDNLSRATVAGVGSRRLNIGEIPTPDQHYAIAYLQHEELGVTNTLIAVAHSAGCIKPHPENKLSYLISNQPASPDHPIFRAFIGRMIPPDATPGTTIELTATEVKKAARATASRSRRPATVPRVHTR